MKTWEVYKNELEQPKQIYLRKTDGVNYCFDANRGLMPCEWKESIWSTIKIDDDWGVAREPFDFMTAVNSDKRISSEDGVIILCYPGALVRNGWLTISQINGKWIIE